MICGIVESEFELQSRYYVHKYPWERHEPPYPPSYGVNSTTNVHLERWILHWMTYKGWFSIKQQKQSNVFCQKFIDYYCLYSCIGQTLNIWSKIFLSGNSNIIGRTGSNRWFQKWILWINNFVNMNIWSTYARLDTVYIIFVNE